MNTASLSPDRISSPELDAAAFPLARTADEVQEISGLTAWVQSLGDMFSSIKSAPPNRYALLAKALQVGDGVVCFGDVGSKADGFENGPANQCYSNAGALALRYPERFVYFEGIAMSLVPLDHAWLWDTRTKRIFDPTWGPATHVSRSKLPDRRIYMGVPVGARTLRDITHATGYWGLFDKHVTYERDEHGLLVSESGREINADLARLGAKLSPDMLALAEPDVIVQSQHLHEAFSSALAQHLRTTGA